MTAAQPGGEAPARRGAAGYPPGRYLESDPDLLRDVIERYRFATVISARDVDDPVVTQLPLTLDAARGTHGMLFGHMDGANPHADLLDGRPVLVLFHGPNGYISPHVYASTQLPTWNSITVHVRGTARVLRDSAAVARGLCGIAEASDRAPGAYRLSEKTAGDRRLLGLVVGFEIDIHEMTGRFKLSQDRDEQDRRLAALALARGADPDDRPLIAAAVRLPLDPGDGPPRGPVRP
ncbi:FMN-binding negative transcriptional regulator [Parafrankia sp. FMc6]|uniref:FMN-binding negative transcriptional regulator n=1 Tax=Parafrankia soli TaxID=2599596 RepID=UPI0034D4F002